MHLFFLDNQARILKGESVDIVKSGSTHADSAIIGIDDNKTKIEIREYRDIFRRSYDPGIIEKQYKAERALVDSICAFYEINRDELIKIRKKRN